MKNLVILFILITNICFSQSFKISNLYAYNALSLSEADAFLIKKGFSLISSSKENGLLNVTYDNRNGNIQEYESLSLKRENNTHSINYTFFSQAKYNEFVLDLVNNNFKLSDTNSSNGILGIFYKRSQYLVAIYKNFDNELNTTTYSILISETE